MNRWVSQEDVAAFQSEFGVLLPDAYVELLKSPDIDLTGMVTTPDGLVLEVGRFFAARRISDEGLATPWGRYLVSAYPVGNALVTRMKHARELGLFPIAAGEESESYVLVDLRSGECLWFNDDLLVSRDQLLSIAGSVEELVGLLKKGATDDSGPL